MTVDAFEERVRQLTQPLNGQYPRPWMTDLQDAKRARLFIVGKNQARGIAVEAVGTPDRYLDALFNRNGHTCRGLYDEVTGGKSSPTRLNTDRLRDLLRQRGIADALETNVICYSTPMSSDLVAEKHSGGSERGEEIFRFLLQEIRPRVLIAHGRDTGRTLGRLMNKSIPAPPDADGPVMTVEVSTPEFSGRIFPIQSLAPPAWNRWSRWAGAYLERVAEAAAEALA